MENPNKYYVYIYLNEDMFPYYVGKGCGGRIREDHGKVKVPSKKYRKKIKENISEEEAYVVESQFISKYGRKIDGGYLDNTMIGHYTDTEIEEFYYQKSLKEQRELEFNQFFDGMIAKSSAEYESELNKLFYIKNNCLKEWNRIYLGYMAGHYDNDEEKLEQIEEVMAA